MVVHPLLPADRIQSARRVADTCVHYGFCTAVCPTYVLDGDENDSPRGRIALMKAMLESGRVPDPKTVLHVDRCLSCLSCATTCPAGVDYRQLVDSAREYIEVSGIRPTGERLYRWLLIEVLTRPVLLRATIRLARPFQGMAAALPGRIGALGRLAAAPGTRAFAVRKDALKATRSDETVSAVSAVALLDGCVQSVVGGEINAATRRVLARAGVLVIEAPGSLTEACCGAMSLHLGDREGATRRAAVLVDHWSGLLSTGAVEAVVVTTSGCGSVLRHWDDLFADDPLRLERARAVAGATLDISELLDRITLSSTGCNLGARATYHDACSLRHGQKITQPPRHVLRKLGFAVADVPEAHLCCGSAGVYNLLEPTIADRLGQRKADNISTTAPDVIVAGNLGCLVQISRFAPAPVAHLVQLVDWAAGGPAPRGLESFRPTATATEMSAPDPVPRIPAVAESPSAELLW